MLLGAGPADALTALQQRAAAAWGSERKEAERQPEPMFAELASKAERRLQELRQVCTQVQKDMTQELVTLQKKQEEIQRREAEISKLEGVVFQREEESWKSSEVLRLKEKHFMEKEAELLQREQALKRLEDSAGSLGPVTPTPARAPMASRREDMSPDVILRLDQISALLAQTEAEKDAGLPAAPPARASPPPARQLPPAPPSRSAGPDPRWAAFGSPPLASTGSPSSSAERYSEAMGSNSPKGQAGMAKTMKAMFEQKVDKSNRPPSVGSVNRPAPRLYGGDFQPPTTPTKMLFKPVVSPPPKKLSLAELLAKDQERLAQ